MFCLLVHWTLQLQEIKLAAEKKRIREDISSDRRGAKTTGIIQQIKIRKKIESKLKTR